MKSLYENVIEYLEADKECSNKDGKWAEFEETVLQTFKMNAPISKHALECAENRIKNEPVIDSEKYMKRMVNYVFDYFYQFNQLANTLDTIRMV